MQNMQRAADGRPALVPRLGLDPKAAPQMTPRTKKSLYAPVAAPGPTTININPPPTAPVAAAAAAPVTTAAPAARRFTKTYEVAGATFASVDGGKYEVLKPGSLDKEQVDHLAGIISKIDTTKQEIVTSRVQNVPAYITIRDKITKQFQAAYPLRPGSSLIPQPTSNDAVELQQWADQNKAAKQGVKNLSVNSINITDRGGKTLYRKYKSLVYPPKGDKLKRRKYRMKPVG